MNRVTILLIFFGLFLISVMITLIVLADGVGR
jgi:hypothetical protein